MVSTLTKPPALRSGDTIGIIAPASNVRLELLEAGCRELEALGFKVRFHDDITVRDRYTAGGESRRSAELLEMLVDPTIRAIFCARGGYGSGHLLPGLDVKALRANPKIFCGASDITMLLAGFLRAGIVSFHGPMVATSLYKGEQGYDRALLEQILVRGEPARFDLTGCEALIEGTATGKLTGGCLSLVVATLGTPWEIDTRESLLVVEDIDCRPYQIDRMLTHLKQAGKLEHVRGFVFGEMLDCDQNPGQDYRIQDVVLSVVENLRVPVLFGFPTGHSVRPNAIVPFGVRGELVVSRTPHFEMLESAVATQ